jgi:cysteinyl-tRNA synthetase
VIKLYNSMTRSIERFTPGDPRNVTMYVCGPTVYDTPHLGNARPAVVFDVLYRLLHHVYGEDQVCYARNYTDIDDKIMARAAELGEDINILTGKTITQYKDVMNALGQYPPDLAPRATDAIDVIIRMIAKLIASGNAYEVEGHVLFDVFSWKAHGVLSGHKQEDLEAGQHREIKGKDLKRGDGDFIMWKPSTDDQPGWDSPWGRGRPGWHIECSAMIDGLFSSKTIDIHGGGADLRFPHHECEISQFEACNHTSLARYWVHNAMVLVDGQKMAKSAGNFITVDALLNLGWHGQVLRMALLSSHYRSPLDWTSTLAAQARQTLAGWHLALEGIEAAPANNDHAAPILNALYHDLNTPLAIARLHAAISEFSIDPEGVAAGVRYAAGVMGIDLVDHEKYMRDRPDRDQIDVLVAERNVARKNKDYAESDRLRAVLAGMGLVIEDRAGETRWRRA